MRSHPASRPSWLRAAAVVLAATFAWSALLAAPVHALTHSPPPNRLGVRVLTPAEMCEIVGQQSGANQVPQAGTGSVAFTGTTAPAGGLTWDILKGGSVIASSNTSNGWVVNYQGGTSTNVSAPGSAALGGGYEVRHIVYAGRNGSFTVVQPATSLRSGGTYPWEAGGGGGVASEDVNLVNGNKTTEHDIVGWTARGGLPVQMTLVHNSQSNQNTTLGSKWTHSFDLYLLADMSGNVTVHWGDDLAYVFTKNVDGSYTAPTGIHDTLVKNANNTYALTTKGQVVYNYNTSLRCTSIVDRNGNTLTLGYSGNLVTSVTDPTSRVLTIGYNGSNKITTITDPLSRQWTIDYDASGRVWKVNNPTLNTVTYSTVYGYNADHCVTSIQTPRGYSWTYS